MIRASFLSTGRRSVWPPRMIHLLLVQATTRGTVRSMRRWIFHLGGLGFIPLGLLDASILPLPGSMDALTIVLAAKRSDLWLYYAIMATMGSVIGEFLTYRLARRGGKEMVERRVSKKTLQKAYAIFERWGFGAIAVAAILPPPIPLLPFVLAAGATGYSPYKFTAAMATGRMGRYTIPGIPSGALRAGNTEARVRRRALGYCDRGRAAPGGYGRHYFPAYTKAQEAGADLALISERTPRMR